MTCHDIWRERNERIFKQKETAKKIEHETAIHQALQCLKDEAKEWALVGAKTLRRMTWKPP
jgi:hypothetical protein